MGAERPTTSAGAGRTAILVVNGFDRAGMWETSFDATDAMRYPWIELCLREVERRSRGSDYDVIVWDNTQIPELREIARSFGARVVPSDAALAASTSRDELVLTHPDSLERLWSELDDSYRYVMTLDTDAFPVRDGWLERLKEIAAGAALTGVWRDEMSDRLLPYVHPSCLFTHADVLRSVITPFGLKGVQDVGQRITLAYEMTGLPVHPLRRTNARNAHFLIGGIYGDLVYHHAAGSRFPLFRFTEGEDRDVEVYSKLRDALFEDVDHVIAVLRGESKDDLGLQWERTEPRPILRRTGSGPRTQSLQ